MRFAVVADIHGNRPALEAVVADIASRGILEVVNLGDCVSGPLWPQETLDLLRDLGWPTVRGNHDRWVGEDRHSLSGSDVFAASALDAESRRWLAALPASLTLTGDRLAFHACPDDDNAYLTEDVVGGRLLPARPATIARRLGPVTAGLVLAAHSHLATVIRLEDGRWIVNPGSVGCPAYDDSTPPAHVSESLSPAARYAIVDHAAAELSVDLVAIPYDHGAASRRAMALGRPDWAHALLHGAMPPR